MACDQVFPWRKTGTCAGLLTAGVLASAGSPGPPAHVKVDEITDRTAQLSWQEGTDNHSPVTSYSIQARTPFSVGWQTAATGRAGGAVGAQRRVSGRG